MNTEPAPEKGPTEDALSHRATADDSQGGRSWLTKRVKGILSEYRGEPLTALRTQFNNRSLIRRSLFSTLARVKEVHRNPSIQSQVTLSQVLLHFLTLGIVSLLMLASHLSFPQVAARSSDVKPEPAKSASKAPKSRRRPGDGFLVSRVVPNTEFGPARSGDGTSLSGAEVFGRQIAATGFVARDPREDVITYTVRAGDTVTEIAEKFGISADTIVWSNPEIEHTPDLLDIGDVLYILPVSGVYHTVAEGDTLQSIADLYKANVNDIAESPYNNLTPPDVIRSGERLVIPGGRKPYIPKRVTAYNGPIPEGAATGTGAFGWPASGMITQKYFRHHQAIDIGAAAGTKIVAADSGYILVTEWNKYSYGNHVVIDHGNGLQTLYAHLSRILVEAGESVSKGEVIGQMGCTGKCTGPHVHFEIRKNGARRNPLAYLP